MEEGEVGEAEEEGELYNCEELGEWLGRQLAKGKVYSAVGMRYKDKQYLVCRDCSMAFQVYRDTRNKSVTFTVKDFKNHSCSGPTNRSLPTCRPLEGTVDCHLHFTFYHYISR